MREALTELGPESPPRSLASFPGAKNRKYPPSVDMISASARIRCHVKIRSSFITRYGLREPSTGTTRERLRGGSDGGRHRQKFTTIHTTLGLKTAAIAQARNRPAVTEGQGSGFEAKPAPQPDTCQTCSAGLN